MAGRTVQVADEIHTVVAMSPSAADFAVALGLEIVGRSSDTPEDVAPAAKTTGSTISPDFNAIAALDPDLVIADAAYHSGRTRDFDRFALPVFVLQATTYEGVFEALGALGDAAGKPDESKAAIDQLKSRADAVIAKAKEREAKSPAPKALILTGGGRDVFAGGSSSYLGDLVRELGGTNVVAEAADGGPIAGFGVIDVGQAATLDPDVVLVLSSGTGGLAAELKANSAWANNRGGEERARVRGGYDVVFAVAGAAGGGGVGGVVGVVVAGLAVGRWPLAVGAGWETDAGLRRTVACGRFASLTVGSRRCEAWGAETFRFGCRLLVVLGSVRAVDLGGYAGRISAGTDGEEIAI